MRLHREGTDVLFSLVRSDFKNASQSGSGADSACPQVIIPRTTPSAELAEAVQHAQKMFELLARLAKAAAEAKVDDRDRPTKARLDQTSRRDPQKIYHKLNKELAALSPSFS
jgi:hypothetical protein